MKCFACDIGALPLAALSPDHAFLAGIAFAFQYSNDAMKARLCSDHQAALVASATKTASSIRAEDRRTNTESKT